MISGGGSAALRPTYAVSALEGITDTAKELGIDVQYTLGALTQKYLPLIDPLISQADGTQGALFEFWNEEPTKDFLDTDSNTSIGLPESAWSTPSATSYAFLADGVVSTIHRFGIGFKDLTFYILIG